MRAMAWVACGACVLIAGSCAPKGTPVLEIALSPKTVTDATPVQVRVVGTKGDGKVGTGTVTITSVRGSLVSPATVQLDGFGTANAALICDRATEPECAQPVRVVAEWTSGGVAVSAEVRLNAPGSGTGGGTGAGGGTGTGGGSATTLTSGRVLVLAGLGTSAQTTDGCFGDGLVDPHFPETAEVGFPCTLSLFSMKVNNGQLYYIDGNALPSPAPGIRRFHSDPWDRVNGMSTYPSSDKNPDEVLFSSCGQILNFHISNSGRVLHDCFAKGTGVYIDDELNERSTLGGYAFGENDSILRSYAVETSDGVSHPTTIPLLQGDITLPVPGGFLAAVMTGFTGCELYMINLDGSSMVLGSFSTKCQGGGLTPDRTLTTIGSGSPATIIETPLNGASVTIFTEGTLTEDYSRLPPRVRPTLSELVWAN